MEQHHWRTVAEAWGGTYTESKRGLRQRRSIDVEHEEVLVHIDSDSARRIRFRATYLMPKGPAFRVFPQSRAAAIGNALGVEDHLVFDPPFDELYVVRASEPEATRSALASAASQQMLQFFRSGSLWSNGRIIRLTGPRCAKAPDVDDATREAETLGAGVRVIASIARCGAELLDIPKKLTGALPMPPIGPWNRRSLSTTQVVVRAVAVSIAPVAMRTGFGLAATGAPARKLPSFALSVDASGQPIAFDDTVVITANARLLLARAGQCNVFHDGEIICITLRESIDHRRLMAAAECVAELALGTVPRGAYR